MSTLPNRTICLVGLRCVGKTSVGQRLAEALELPFVDLDEELQRPTDGGDLRAGDLLATLGEEAFRDLEQAALERVLAEASPRVLATGGGVVLRPANRALLLDRAHTLWLQAPAEVLVQRWHSDPTPRPALTDEAPLVEVLTLERERSPLYAEVSQAPFDAGGSIDQVLAALLSHLGA